MIDVLDTFRPVSDLGADIPCLVVVKRADAGAEFAERQAERESRPLRDRYLMPLRDEINLGYVSLTTLRDFSRGEPGSWRTESLEPHDAILENGEVVVASTGELRILCAATGRTLRSIQCKHFTNLHSVCPDPCRPGYWLTTNPGGDDLLEVHRSSGQIVAQWIACEHGFDHGPFEVRIVSPDSRRHLSPQVQVLDAFEAHEALAHGRPPGDWVILADPQQITHPLGLEKWQRAAEPNWAGYSPDGTRTLVSFFCSGQVAVIDRTSGEALHRRGGFLWPHGLIPLCDGRFLVTDTGAGHVLLLGDDLRTLKDYDFSTFSWPPIPKGHEWLQFTSVLDAGDLFVTVDGRRNCIHVWSSKERIITTYPTPPRSVVKLVTPVTAGDR